MKKRCLALILAIMLCIGILPHPALAEGEDVTDGEVAPDYAYMYPEGENIIPDDTDDEGTTTPVEGAAVFAPYHLSEDRVSVSVPVANTSRSVQQLTVNSAEVGNGYNTGAVEANDTGAVEANDTEAVEANDTEAVEANDTEAVEANDTEAVEANDTEAVEANDTEAVEANDTEAVEANDTETVEANDTEAVEANDTEVVEANDTEVVEANDTEVVEANDTEVVEANDTEAVEANDTEEVAIDNEPQQPEQSQQSEAAADVAVAPVAIVIPGPETSLVEAPAQAAPVEETPVIVEDQVAAPQLRMAKGAAPALTRGGETIVTDPTSPISINDATVTLTPDSATYDGTNKRPTVTAVTLNGEPLGAADYRVEYSPDSDWINADSYVVHVWGEGNYTGCASKFFDIHNADVSGAIVTLTSDSATYDGTDKKPTVTAVTLNGKPLGAADYRVEYSPDSDWINADSYVVYVWGEGNYTGCASKGFDIHEADISSANVTVTGDTTYTGTQLTPAVVVTLGSKTLVKGTDYELSFGDNVNVADGGSVTVTGIGNYTGSVSKTFTINRASISGANVTVTGDTTYTGAQLTPAVEVTLGSKTLVKGTDYELSYGSNVNVADGGSVTVTGQGNYTGTASVNFTIARHSLNAVDVECIFDSFVTYETPEAAVAALVLKLGDRTLQKDVDYTVETDVRGNEVKLFITGIDNFVGQGSVSGPLSHIYLDRAEVILSPQSAVYTGSAVNKPGEAVKVYLIGGVQTLVYGTDYEVSYSDGWIDAGEYTVTVTGKGNCTGTASATFTINRASISSANVNVTGDTTYTGAQLTPAVEVTLGSKTLVKGTDYELSYGSNVNVADVGSVTVTGKGNYNGTATKTFTISPISISGANVTLSLASATYTGSNQKPAVTSVVLDGSELGINEYNVFYTPDSEWTDVGEYTVTVTGKGNYTGSVSKTFTISPVSLEGGRIEGLNSILQVSDVSSGNFRVVVGANILATDEYTYTAAARGTVVTVTVTGQNNYKDSFSQNFTRRMNLNEASVSMTNSGVFTYTGSNVVLDLEVTFDGEALQENEDYALPSGLTLREAGNYTVTISAIDFDGSRTYGSKDVSVRILPVSLSGANVTVTGDTTYTGAQLTPAVEVTLGSKTLVKDTDYELSYGSNVNVTDGGSVTVTGKGNYNGTATKTFTINPRDLAECTVASLPAATNSLEWSGEATLTFNGVTLQSGVDYYAAGGVDDPENGVCKLVFYGDGNFMGQKRPDADPALKTYDLTTALVIVDGAPFTYNGTAFAPHLDVSVGDMPLDADVDFEVTSTPQSNAGTWNLTLTAIPYTQGGSGLATGSKTVSYTILPRSLQADGTLEGVVAPTTKAGVEADLQVKVGELELTREDYDLEVDEQAYLLVVTVTGKGNYKDTLTADYTSITSLLVDLGSTDVAVIVGGNLPGGAVNDTGSMNFTYTGESIRPAVNVKAGNQTLAGGTDYTVSYGENINAGTGSIIIQPSTNSLISGNRTISFIISARSIADGEISGVTLPANATAILSSGVTVKAGNRTLEAGVDYDLSVTDVDGVVTVSIIGKGNYKDTLTADYTSITSLLVDLGSTDVAVIVGGNLPGGAVNGTGSMSFTYTGESIRPAVNVKAGNQTLAGGTDYTVSYGENINAGTGSIIIQPSTNSLISGNRTISFIISARSIADGEISGVTEPVNLTELREDSFTLTVDNRTLEAGKDFDWTATEANGTVTLTIQGKGNYQGELSLDYAVAQEVFDLNGTDVIVTIGDGDQSGTGTSNKGFFYSGVAIEPFVNVRTNNQTFQRGLDYMINYSNNVNAGTGHIVLSPGSNGRLDGSRIVDFVINPVDIENNTVNFGGLNVTKGGSLELEALLNGSSTPTSMDKLAALLNGTTVTVNGRTLELGKDFQLNVTKMTDGNCIRIDLSGRGNYAGQMLFNLTAPVAAEPEAPNLLQVTLERLSEIAMRIIALLESRNGDTAVEWHVMMYPNGVDAQNGSDEPYSESNPKGYVFINILAPGMQGVAGGAIFSNVTNNTSTSGMTFFRYNEVINLTEGKFKGSLNTNATYGMTFTETVITDSLFANNSVTRHGGAIYVRVPEPSEGIVTFTPNGEVKKQDGNVTEDTNTTSEGVDLSAATVSGLDPSKAYTEAEIEMMGLEGLKEGVDYQKTVTVETDENGQTWWVVTFTAIGGKSFGQKVVRVKQAPANNGFVANCKTLGHERVSEMKIKGRFVREGVAITCYELTITCSRCGEALGTDRFIVTTSAQNGAYGIVPGRDVNLTEAGDGLRLNSEAADEGDLFLNGKVLKSLDEVLVKGTRYDYARLAGEGCAYGFTDTFLASLTDGEYELLLLNGDEYWPLVVTVQGHRFTAVRAADLPAAPEMTEAEYDAWRLAGTVRELTVGAAK